ncbi:MAG: transcriptional regulator PpsR [Pseudomonadota bacterium]
MDATNSGRPNIVRSATDLLGALPAQELTPLLAQTADVALLLDDAGVITDVALGDIDMPEYVVASWRGQHFGDTVTKESQDKVRRLLQGSPTDGVAGPAQVNHGRSDGPDLPVRYTAARLSQNQSVAIGRDLTRLADAQRRLLESQRAAERSYAEMRRSETRFRQYFHNTDEAVVFVDATDRIADANRIAIERWRHVPRMVGRRITDLFEAHEKPMIASVVAAARLGSGMARCQFSGGEALMAPLRGDPGTVLIRFLSGDGDPSGFERLGRVVETMPDPFVVTDGSFNIVTTNHAFADLTDTPSPERLVGLSVDRWLGRSGVDLSVIRAALADAGSLRGYNTVMQGELGQRYEVEISATRAVDRGGELIGLALRQVPRTSGPGIGRSPQEFTDLVGRVPIKEIVRETTDSIERMCIEAALELSGDNRASAAELLGLSRQSLYVKMRRYGIVDGDGLENGTSDHLA